MDDPRHQELKDKLFELARKHAPGCIDISFYSQAQWQARGENICQDADMTMAFEGSFYAAWNINGTDGLFNDFHNLINSLGYRYEQGLAWTLHFYKLEPSVKPQLKFIRYLDGKAITAEQLSRDPQAQAEVSNPDTGYFYVDVALWNKSKRQWERFAFRRFEEGEDGWDSEYNQAVAYAEYINGTPYPKGFVKDMPNYTGD